MSEIILDFTLADLNKFAPKGIVFETKKRKLENGKYKDFLYAVPVEYKKNYPNIDYISNFNYTPYSLDDLKILLDRSLIANAKSDKDLMNSLIERKGNDFGNGDYPYKANKNLFSLLNSNNQNPMIDWNTLEAYGKIVKEYLSLSSNLANAENAITKHNSITTPKKSIFNKKHKKYIAELGELYDNKEGLSEQRDALHKKVNEAHEKLIKGFNATAILAYVYNAGLKEKAEQKFQSKNKYKASVERVEKLGVKHGKKSDIVHAETLLAEKKFMKNSPYKPIILDKNAAKQYDEMAKKVRDGKIITPEENKKFIKTFFDKDYE